VRICGKRKREIEAGIRSPFLFQDRPKNVSHLEVLVAFHFHTSDTESKVIRVFYTRIMTSLLAYFNDEVIA